MTEINTSTVENASYLISLQEDIVFNGTVGISANAVTVIGNGHEIYFPDGGDGNRVYISNGATANLGAADGSDVLTLRGPGASKPSTNVPGLIFLNESSTLNMYDGVTVRDFINNNYFGGGVTVRGYSNFHMFGGTVKNCGIDGGSVNFGGGVAVTEGSVFTMDGGTITDCFATTTYDDYGWQIPSGAGGGVFVGQGSTFIFNGGTISNNTASSDGGGVAIIASSQSYGNHSSFGYLDSRFEMNGGIITGNKATYVGGGVAALGTYINADAIVAPNPGSGAPENPGVYINGGEITSNEASDGGGLFFNWLLTDTIVKDCTVSENKADNGAGISVLSKWTQADIENCIIIDNAARECGGGIQLNENSDSSGTTVKNCTVSGNSAVYVGGAVAAIDGSAVTIDGCTVTDNKLADAQEYSSYGKGAGVYYGDSETGYGYSALTVTGKTVIQDNTYNGVQNNLYVPYKSSVSDTAANDNAYVFNVGSLGEGAKIGLTDESLLKTDSPSVSFAQLTAGYKTNNADTVPKNVFTSDHEGYYADYGAVYEGTYNNDGNDYSNEVRLIKQPLLSYDVNEGIYTYEYAPAAPDSDDNVTLAAPPQRDGADFLGWSDSSDGYGELLQAGTKLPLTDNRLLYAVWQYKCANDSSFTASFAQKDFASANCSGRYIWFDKAPGVGTAVTMSVRLTQGTDSSVTYYCYWIDGSEESYDYTNSDGSTGTGIKIPLIKFTAMGTSSHYGYADMSGSDGAHETVTFTVNFANDATDVGTTRFHFTTPCEGGTKTEKSVAVKLVPQRTFGIASSLGSEEGSINEAFTISYSVTAPQLDDTSKESNYSGKKLALVFQADSADVLPASSRLFVGDTAYYMNKNGQFIVPLNNIIQSLMNGETASENLTVRLESGISHRVTLKAALYASATDNDSAPLMGEKVAETAVTLKAGNTPSVKAVSLTARMLKKDLLRRGMSLEYLVKDIGIEDKVTVEIQKKTDGVYQTVDTVLEKVNGEASENGIFDITDNDAVTADNNSLLKLSFGSGADAGTYRILIKVTDGNGKVLLSAPYNFMVLK